MAANTTGMYSGRQPAITALAATRSIVALPPIGGMAATTSSAGRPTDSTHRRTLSSVGGTRGRPSLQPVRYINSMRSTVSVVVMVW